MADRDAGKPPSNNYQGASDNVSRYLTIKSRLFIMLVVAFFSTLVIGYIGYESGKSALT